MLKKKNLGFRLVTAGVSAVMIPLIVVGFFSITKTSKAIETLSKNQFLTVATELAGATQLFLSEELKVISTLSGSNAAQQAAEKVSTEGVENASQEIAALNSELSHVFKKMGGGYELIVVADAKGTVFADSDGGTQKGVSVAQRVYFAQARAGKTNISDPVKSKASGKPVVPVCSPIRSGSGRFQGVLVAVLKLDSITDRITSVKIGKTGYPFLVDKNGLLIAHPNEKHNFKLNLKQIKGMEAITARILAQETGVDRYVFEGDKKMAGFAPVTLTGWSIGVTQNEKEFSAAVRSVKNMILLFALFALAVTIPGVSFFARSIAGPIKKAVEMLIESSEQVASASDQISSTSQSLAQGSAEQAASLEETSSALEEMSSMTKQNAQYAGEADNLMKEANRVISQADKSMNKLTLSMESITHTSQETQKIIKTIDEIAFQTNLLALNAAVEAARAGEAGAGFAVVADEVRNLAMRAAEAARNTTNLIEGSVKQIREGSELVHQTNEAFSEVAQGTSKVGQLVGEISAASNEQAQGIEQVNHAVLEMDKVTQQNAANAEESAAAAEQMNSQALQMKKIVDDLVETIGESRSMEVPQKKSRTAQASLPGPRVPSQPRKIPEENALVPQAAKEVRPNEVIPFDEEDFSDF